jgi:hypothetical protein
MSVDAVNGAEVDSLVAQLGPQSWPAATARAVAPPAGFFRLHHLLLLRWAALALAVAVAFHETFYSIAQQTNNGDPLTFLFLLPFWGATIALGTHLHRRSGLPIHDRQIDWVVAVWLLVIDLMVGKMLIPRLGVTEQLVRADVFALVLFLIVGSTMLFGTRLTGQYWETWIFLMFAWPLPYRLIGAALGGTSTIYALLNLGFSAVAVALGLGGSWVSRLRITGIALAAGIIALITTGLASPSSISQQTIPALTTLVVAALLVAFETSRGMRPPLRLRGDGMARTAVPKPMLAAAVLVAVALGMSLFVPLAPPVYSLGSFAQAGVGWTTGPTSLAGWRTTSSSQYPWAPNYFGQSALWVRYGYLPTNSTVLAPGVVVDALTTPTAGPLSVYPSISCYKLSVPFVEASAPVSLGYGVSASIFYANSLQAESPVSDKWTMLTWVWRIPSTGSGSYQRLTLITLDGSTRLVGTPVPSRPGINGTLQTTFSEILRGATIGSTPPPDIASVHRLEGFAREIVAKQASPSARDTVIGIAP